MLRYNVRGAPLVHAFVRCRLTHDRGSAAEETRCGVPCGHVLFSAYAPCRSLERISAQSPSEIVGGGARRVASRGAHAPTAPSHVAGWYPSVVLRSLVGWSAGEVRFSVDGSL